jgi:oligogalacturonide lyase
MDLKTGENRLLTEAAALDPSSLSLFPDERSFVYFDGPALYRQTLENDRVRRIYQVPTGYEHGAALAMSTDGKRAALVEKSGGRSRLRLVNLDNGDASTIIESEGLLRNPIPRPNAQSILYQNPDDAWWIVDYNGRNMRRLETAPGRCGQALWSPDGRTVLYLNIPAAARELNTLREFLVADNRDLLIAKTTQFVRFAPNRNASVFVCASGSKASPFITLMLRMGRELTLCEHRASDPSRITTVFSPDSRWIFFESDRHGKPAIYAMAVSDLVEQTDS